MSQESRREPVAAYEPPVAPVPVPTEGDLSVTALYTSGVWAWGRVEHAELLTTPEAGHVFRATNFFLALGGWLRRFAPSLRHSLLQRHVIHDRLASESGAPQVLELAAGLSARGARLTESPEVQVVELDLAPMIARKRELLARTAAGRAVAARPNLRLVAGDVRSTDLTGLVDRDQPVHVVAEGLLMYLDARQQGDLWRRVAALLAAGAGGSFAFDLVPACEQPRPGLVGRLLGWLMRRFTGGRAFAVDRRTRDDIVTELRASGFAQVDLVEPATAPDAWRLPHLDRSTQMLVFRCRVAPALPAAPRGPVAKDASARSGDRRQLAPAGAHPMDGGREALGDRGLVV